MNGLVAACEAIAHEGKQYAVDLFIAVEERANVATLVQLGSGKPDSFSLLSHRVACSCESSSLLFWAAFIAKSEVALAVILKDKGTRRPHGHVSVFYGSFDALD